MLEPATVLLHIDVEPWNGVKLAFVGTLWESAAIDKLVLTAPYPVVAGAGFDDCEEKASPERAPPPQAVRSKTLATAMDDVMVDAMEFNTFDFIMSFLEILQGRCRLVNRFQRLQIGLADVVHYPERAID
jgi:hypothetical protein